MRVIEIFPLLQRKILVTRESALAVRDEIDSAIKDDGEVTLDFAGVDAVTPSFVDEVMGMIDDARIASLRGEVHVIFAHTPTPLSGKFLAIGKRHRSIMSQAGSDAWEIRNSSSAPA